jgi:esterase/lipase
MSESPVSDDLHKSVARLMLNYGQLEYGDVCQNWRIIEGKAQGAVAIAGIFIGGVFALMNALNAMPTWALVFLVLVLWLLVAGVLCALRALFVADCECLDDTSSVLEKAHYVLEAGSEEEGKRHIRTLVSQLSEAYARVNSEIHRSNLTKAAWVHRSQTCLAAGIVISVAIITVGAFGGWY